MTLSPVPPGGRRAGSQRDRRPTSRPTRSIKRLSKARGSYFSLSAECNPSIHISIHTHIYICTTHPPTLPPLSLAITRPSKLGPPPPPNPRPTTRQKEACGRHLAPLVVVPWVMSAHRPGRVRVQAPHSREHQEVDRRGAREHWPHSCKAHGMSTKKLCNDCPFHTCHVPIGLWDRVWDPPVMACTPLALPQRGGGLTLGWCGLTLSLLLFKSLLLLAC